MFVQTVVKTIQNKIQKNKCTPLVCVMFTVIKVIFGVSVLVLNH